jgi:hypothetical protein
MTDEILESFPGETAHRVHGILEDGDYGLENTRETVAEFYNEFKEEEDPATAAVSSYFIEQAFENFLDSGKYGEKEREEAVASYIEYQQEEWDEKF